MTQVARHDARGSVDVVAGGDVAISRRYIPALDGLRALAVTAALLFHAGVLQGGFLGVDLFFVVSGFLITGLLLDESVGSGRVRLGRFWGRRIRRLAPALLAVLGVIQLWAHYGASPAMAQTTTKQSAWSLIYLNNWFALFGNVGYWGATATKTPLNHLWSLAIEEQFYLVWPVLLALAVRLRHRRRDRERTIVWIAAVAIVASAAWQWWAADRFGANRAYLGTDARAGALFIGCLLAVLVRRVTAKPSAARPDRRAWNAAVAAAVLWLGVSWVTADLGRATLYHGWLVSCSAAAGVVVIAVALQPSAWYTRVLSTRPLVWIGKRSYSLYLWHWPIWVMLSPEATGSSGANLWVLRMAVTTFAAAASYAWIEQPIRTSRFSGRQLVPALGAVGIALGVVAVAFAPALPPAMGSQPVTVVGTQGTGHLKILVAGDSWARNMGFGLALADADHRNTYINLGDGGCGLMAGHAECARQPGRWSDALATNHPDVVLLMTGTFDGGAGATTVDGLTVAPCSPEYDAAYGRKLDEVINLLRGPDHLPVYLTTVRDNPVHRSSSDCINSVLSEAAARNSAGLLDLHGQLCPTSTCVSDHGGVPIYDDTMHLDPAGQRWIGGWILDTLQHSVTPQRASSDAGPVQTCPSDVANSRPLPVASYVSHPEAPYLDTSGSELTDGLHGSASFGDPAWQGWQGEPTDIVLTLGEAQPVCAVTSTWLQVPGAAIFLPTELDVYVSDTEGELGTLLGTAQPPAGGPPDQTVTINMTANTAVSGRYVTVRVRSLTAFSFVDEVTPVGSP